MLYGIRYGASIRKTTAENLSTRAGDTRTAYRKSIFRFSHAQNERSCLQSPVVFTTRTPFSLFPRCAGNVACYAKLFLFVLRLNRFFERIVKNHLSGVQC